MSAQSHHADYVRKMLAVTLQIADYSSGMSKDAFLADTKTQDAIIMKLLVIGELAAKLIDAGSPFVTDHPDVPWHQMKGMRNRMAHGYFELNLDVVWETIKVAIPELEENLRAIVD